MNAPQQLDSLSPPPRHPILAPVQGGRELSPKLLQKLARATAAIGDVAKRGHNQRQGYAFRREQDIVDAVKPALTAEGIQILPPDVLSVETRPSTKSDGTRGMDIIRTKVRWTFADIETGDSIDAVVYGEGADPSDKALPKSMTAALKYLLLETFLIGTDDDAEKDPPGPAAAHAGPPHPRAPAPGSAVAGPGTPVNSTTDGPISDGQARLLYARAKATGWTDAQRDANLIALARANSALIHKWDDFPRRLVDAALAMLDAGPAGGSTAPPTDLPVEPEPAMAGAAPDPDDIPF